MADYWGPARFKEMKDEEIVEVAQSGGKEAVEYLLEKYRLFVQSRLRPYFLVGAEKEDLIQEGMIGLFEAIKDFKANRSSFRSFAELCVRRQVVTAIRSATRQKQIPLNSSISMNNPLYEDNSQQTLADVLTSKKNPNPEKMFLAKENINYLKQELRQALTDLEWQVLVNYLEEKSYEEIAGEIEHHEKTVDNALSRIKRKAASIRWE